MELKEIDAISFGQIPNGITKNTTLDIVIRIILRQILAQNYGFAIDLIDNLLKILKEANITWVKLQKVLLPTEDPVINELIQKLNSFLSPLKL
jgi:hypothetical protein